MNWLTVTILSYFILAVVFLVDKYLLKGSIPNPKVYTFYVGCLGILILLIAPFIGFYMPETPKIILSILAGALSVYALFWFYKALNNFEASRIVPAIGGLVPLFTFGLVYLTSLGREILPPSGIAAFILLIFGSILISIEREKTITLKSFQISITAAFLLSLSVILTKYVYFGQPFWNGFIWLRVGGFLMALCFLFFTKEVKEEIFNKRVSLKKKTMGIFFANQAAGGGAAILQNWAIALTPLAYIAVINALQGVQYSFLLIFAVLLSFKFPQILKEEISKRIIIQKIFAVLLIGLGLLFLFLK